MGVAGISRTRITGSAILRREIFYTQHVLAGKARRKENAEGRLWHLYACSSRLLKHGVTHTHTALASHTLFIVPTSGLAWHGRQLQITNSL